MDLSLFSYTVVEPLARFGLVDKVWGIHLETVLYTWIAMFLLFTGIAVVRLFFFQENGLCYVSVECLIEMFATMCSDSVGYFRYDYFSFVASLFTFTFTCCVVSLIPYIDEATKDANTTFALAFFSFLYISYQKIRQDGIFSYLKRYIGREEMPLVIRILMSPLETMGQLSKIISMSFRLFGNVLGGAVVYNVLLSVFLLYKSYFIACVYIGGALWLLVHKVLRLTPDSTFVRYLDTAVQFFFVLSWLQIFFGIFESLIQSFVISMLSLTYLSLAVEHDLKNDKRGIEW